MTPKRGVCVEEKTAETASDYDAGINFIVNSHLSKSQIDNERGCFGMKRSLVSARIFKLSHHFMICLQYCGAFCKWTEP